MRDRKVATRYAGALLESAQKAGVLDGVAESFAAVHEVVRENRDLVTFLYSPQVPEAEKKKLLKDVFGGKIEDLLLTFFYLLLDKNRIENLQDIAEAFADLVERERGVLRAGVVTAVPLAEDLEKALREKLAAMTGKTVILAKKIDPAVLGGVCVTMGDKILDGTVRTNLDRLRKQLGKASVR